MHYKRWMRHGDLGPAKAVRHRDDSGLSVTFDGYVLEWRDGKQTRQHRRIWEDHHGPIPKGHHVHHTNGIVDDNRIENLEMLNPVEHSKKHWVVPYQGDGCTVEGCTKKYRSRGLCAVHYNKWLRERKRCSVA